MPERFPSLSPYLTWPPFVAAPGASVADMVRGLEASDRWSAADVAAGRQSQLLQLLDYVAKDVPYYRVRRAFADALREMHAAPDRFDEIWRTLPVLTKETLRSDSAALNADAPPPAHLPLGLVRTSGSTGIAVEMRTTVVTRTLWYALAVREHLWQKRDFSKRLGVIRSLKAVKELALGASNRDWGPPVGKLYRTGPASVIHVGQPLDRLIAWLRRFDPHYLLTYPSVAKALFDELGPGGKPTSLEELRLISEPVDKDFESALRSTWGVRVSEIYSTNENGKIAIRCLEHDNLHVQEEGIFVEIIDESGRHCAPGESGRVLLTSLHNLAKPLIRYQIGDYATVGATCGCGRASLVIGQVLGRVRNMATSPDGRRFYPIALHKIRAVAPIRQSQWVQTAEDAIELRAVLDRPLTEEETALAAETVSATLGYPYRVTVVAIDAVVRGPTGKFEEFISLLPE